MELMNKDQKGSLSGLARKKMNIFRTWTFGEIDLNWIREFKKNHPVEFFRGAISLTPKELDLQGELTQKLINVIRADDKNGSDSK